MRIIETRRAPNPRRLRIFLAEKGIEVAFDELDLMTGALKGSEFSKLNPWHNVPVLVFDDGHTLAESVAICRYFEEICPRPALMGEGARERSDVEMWQRRMELGLFHRVAQVFRHLNPKMAPLEVPQIAQWGEANKDKVMTELAHLDARLSDSTYVAGARYTIADITALVAIDFMKPARLEVPASFENIARWYRDVSSRPSAGA